MPTTPVIFESDATGPLPVLAARGREAMNALAEWTVDVTIPDAVDVADLVRAGVTLRIGDEDEGTERAVPLLVVGVRLASATKIAHRYQLTLASPQWPHTQRRGYRVFVGLTTQEIVGEILGPATRFKWRLTGSYKPRPQCVMYREDEWSFVERLLADEGIAYWSDADDAGPILVFGDDPRAHDGLDGDAQLMLRDARGMVGARAFWDFEIADAIATEATHVRDFDVRQPLVYIEGKAGLTSNGALDYFEMPASVLDHAAAKARAEVRLEQLQRDARRAFARSDCVRVQPGRLVDVDGCADDEGNARWLVVLVEHAYAAAERYTNRAVMVPSARTYRPAIAAFSGRAPRVGGVEPAFTTGPAGAEIHVDDLGRVKLRMPWDRSGVTDDKSSYWVRTMQTAMGGAMILPRVGWEVSVAYQYGDPDRPVVLGRVYNGTAVTPYALPANSTTTTLQSATSPGGAGTHEIRMNDSSGKQEVFVHATKDQTVHVGHDSQTRIAGNETLDVGLSCTLTVKGSHAHSVGGAQQVSVATAHTLKVNGTRSERIGGMEIIQVGGDREVATKPYQETVGAAYALECNQSNTHVTGAFVLTVGGSMATAAGMSAHESVAAMRTESVGGARVIVAGKYVEEVKGTKSISAGAATDKAGAKVVTFTKADGAIQADSLALEASGPVLIAAPKVTFDVGGALKAGALELAGGKLRSKDGSTKLKGTITRQGETKIE